MAPTEQLGKQIAAPTHPREREPARRLDEESQEWIDRLSPHRADRAAAIDELHALLLKATRFELNRRRAALSHLAGNDHDDLAHQSVVAVTVDDVPIDVLAERLETTRGALYKTIHDARRKLRAALVADGLSVGEYVASVDS